VVEPICSCSRLTRPGRQLRRFLPTPHHRPFPVAKGEHPAGHPQRATVDATCLNNGAPTLRSRVSTRRATILLSERWTVSKDFGTWPYGYGL